MVPPFRAPFRGRLRGRLRGRENGTRTEGGGVPRTAGGVSHPPLPFFAVVVRVFRPRPADPNRASGEGRDGSDPPFLTAGAVRQGGGCPTQCPTGCPIPPAVGEVAPVCMYPCGKAPRPACGPDDEPRRAAPCLTDSSARSWSSSASVSGAPGRGPARFPRPIPWRSSCPIPHPERVPRRRRVVLRGARRGGVPRRPISHQHIPDLVRPDGRPCGAPVPPAALAPFAFGGWAGDRRRRGPSPGQSHREPGSRMADDPGAGPLYRRGDFRGRRVRQDVRVYAPVRAPALRLASDESRAARGGACP